MICAQKTAGSCGARKTSRWQCRAVGGGSELGGLSLHPTLGERVPVPLSGFVRGVFGRDVPAPTVGWGSKAGNCAVFLRLPPLRNAPSGGFGAVFSGAD